MISNYLRLLKWTMLAGLLLPAVGIVCGRFGAEEFWSLKFTLLIGGCVLVAAIMQGCLLAVIKRSRQVIDVLSSHQAVTLDGIKGWQANGLILLSAAVSLILQLTMIRWLGAVYPVFALYKNFVLLGCFLGLGWGYALARVPAIPLVLALPVLTLEVVLLSVLRYGIAQWRLTPLWMTPITESLNMGITTVQTVPEWIAIYLLLTIVFMLTVLVFIPIGQLCGRAMVQKPNLTAYGYNLLGSLLGVLATFGLSLLWTPPVVWFVLVVVLLLWVFRHDARAMLIASFSALALVVCLSWPVAPGVEFIYSPYQLLERGAGENGLTRLKAAGFYYQRVHDLRPDVVAHSGQVDLKHISAYYGLPYELFGKNPDRVAVVGSGMGNDVAAALRAGAGSVSAIEIDPAIMLLGAQYHPESPYSNSRVTAHVNDARTYLRTTPDTFDMVVYGLLDSHTLLSHGSSVRLDSFVYTIQGLQDARQRLDAEGMIALSFCVISPEIGRKIYLMMEAAFDGHPPVCIEARYDGAVLFAQKKEGGLAVDWAALEAKGFRDVTGTFASPALQADVSTDDLPFFYMPRRVYPLTYVGCVGLVLFLTLLVSVSFMREKLRFTSVPMFFLGAAFMLVETKSITELGLTFGNTWQTIGIVIAGILFMAYLANTVVGVWRPRSPWLAFVLLGISLAAGYWLSRHGGLGSLPLAKTMTVALLTCPIFFSGIVFSTLLGESDDLSGAMAANLVGAITGGLMEYNSMYFGFSSLYLLALGLYAMAAVAFVVRR